MAINDFPNQDFYKRAAALKALEYIESGMVLGIGTGSTTKIFIDLLGDAIQSGKLRNISGVPTSIVTEKYAQSRGIQIVDLNQYHSLDVAVDGADEIDQELNLIKGLGKALLREKIVEIHARKFIVIADSTKLVSRLGEKNPLPVEIVPFGWSAHIDWLNTLGCKAMLWEENGKTLVTDNNNFLVKCQFVNGINAPRQLARELNNRPGIVEHGLFLDMADIVIVAGKEGVNILRRSV